MSFFRYPGGKSKLRKQIIAELSDAVDTDCEYREPFFGGGSIGLGFLKEHPAIKKAWINDKDYGIACLWTTLISFPGLLKEHVQNFRPSVEEFDLIKEELLQEPPNLRSDYDIAEYGFKKLAIHQISYSGLGTKSGGPLGGRKQESIYKVDCRWSPDYVCKKIDKIHDQLSTLEIRDNSCTNLDFTDVISDTSTCAMIYLDPPYYIKGNDLYQHGFKEEDHNRLARCLEETKHKWLLSYDDCEEIRSLYEWAEIGEIGVNYSITTARAKTELLIWRT